MSAPPDELLNHDYDGIKEFDNPLPKWWVYLFYGTILFAVTYIPYYHFGPGVLPGQAWATDMTAWYADHPPPELASAAELEGMAADPSFVAAGQSIFAVRCVSCHGPDGGGLVGPNLTDDSTLYGFGRDEMVAVIYHGTKFGMLSWKDQLSLEEIYQVGAYVHTLRGTTPANPKAPEGVAFPAGQGGGEATAPPAAADDGEGNEAAETGGETGDGSDASDATDATEGSDTDGDTGSEAATEGSEDGSAPGSEAAAAEPALQGADQAVNGEF